ncbi:hypothetical protein EDD16DRAFT_1516020 [Pisolithus croceorrhizus]|nr:hypothetical protein EV401DRAFT_1890588 [Pisolithus croceorrhizus]KAI6128924.1 hypothetical protein EDD16DRAFT_1516020 [Pisolithus croceorrhizus]
MLKLKETESTPWHPVCHLPLLGPSPTNHDQNLDSRLRLEAQWLPGLTCHCHLTFNPHSAWQHRITNLDLGYPLLVRSIALSTVDPSTILCGHTLSMVPDEDENHDPAGEGNYSDPPIDKALPSEDNCFAESVLQGGKCGAKLVLLPTLNTQVRWNVVQIPMLPQTQGMTHPPSATLQPLGGINPPIPPVCPATQGAEPWQIQFYKPEVQDVLKHVKQFSYCDMASINSFPLPLNTWRKRSAKDDHRACQSQMAGGLTMQMIFLWESLGNWHLALRKKAHIYVTQHYKWDPENHREVNSSIMKDLLGDCGVFLRDGIDENLKVILDKMVSSQSEVNFRVSTYTLVYLEILGLMKKCDTSMIHAEKANSL